MIVGFGLGLLLFAFCEKALQKDVCMLWGCCWDVKGTPKGQKPKQDFLSLHICCMNMHIHFASWGLEFPDVQML